MLKNTFSYIYQQMTNLHLVCFALVFPNLEVGKWFLCGGGGSEHPQYNKCTSIVFNLQQKRADHSPLFCQEHQTPGCDGSNYPHEFLVPAMLS